MTPAAEQSCIIIFSALSAAGQYGYYMGGIDERDEQTFDWTDTGTPYQGTNIFFFIRILLFSQWYPDLFTIPSIARVVYYTRIQEYPTLRLLYSLVHLENLCTHRVTV